MKKLACILTLLCLNFVSVYAETTEAAISGLLPEALGINVVSRMVGGKNYHFVTYHDEFGNIGTKIFDTDFVEIQEDEIPVSEPKVISDEVFEAFEKNPSKKQKLLIGVSFPTVLYPEHSFSSEGYTDELGRTSIYVDGELIDEFQHKLLQEEYDRIQNEYLAELLSVKSAAWQELRKRNSNPDLDEAIGIAQNRGKGSFVAEMTEGEMFELLENARGMVDGVELHHEPKEDLANAMLATGVDPWMFDLGGQGQGIGIYMTEANCPPYNNGVLTTQNYYAFGATWSSQQHPQQVSYVLRTVSPQSFLYCRPGRALPNYYELNGVSGKPPIKVINASFSYDTSEYTADTAEWDQFIYNYNVTIVNSAGNTGEASGYVGEPSAALNSITVGNYIMAHTISFMGNSILIPATINSTSSYVNPETGNQKPEVVAPGTNLNLPDFDFTSSPGPYTGTSFSAPHVAAIIADYMSDFSDLTTRPHLTKAFILSAATDVVFGDYTKVGEGGVDYASGFDGAYYKEWEKSSATVTDWNSLDAADPTPNNGYLDYYYYIYSSRSKTKIAISWATQGTYTRAHRTDTYPIGVDLDMCVYDPNGSLVGCSASRFNNYEVVTFDPSVTGVYRIRVSKYALRDTQSKLHIGLRAISIN